MIFIQCKFISKNKAFLSIVSVNCKYSWWYFGLDKRNAKEGSQAGIDLGSHNQLILGRHIHTCHLNLGLILLKLFILIWPHKCIVTKETVTSLTWTHLLTVFLDCWKDYIILCFLLLLVLLMMIIMSIITVMITQTMSVI